MSYRDFTLGKLHDAFGITLVRQKLFNSIIPKTPTELLLTILKKNKLKKLTTEKAKSEYIVSPILSEIEDYYNESISLFSGEVINADRKLGLTGEIDFVFTKGVDFFNITAPVIAVVEAKKADIEHGIGQCAAQLVGMKVFNEKNNKVTFPLYGCVTNAELWLFLKLEDNCITIDIEKYYTENISDILGIFSNIIKNSL